MVGGANDDGDEMITAINVVPLVDIVLVVLIIFMLTADLIARQSIDVELPAASTGSSTESSTVALTLSRTGELFLNDRAITEPALRVELASLVARARETQAIIAADKDVSHGQVVRLIDLVRQLGISKFALNIDPAPVVASDAPAP